MHRNYFLVLIAIAIAYCAPVIAFGKDDLGGGVEIDGNTLTFFVLKEHYILVDFTNSIIKGGIILNDSGESIFTESKKLQGESRVEILLPVYGDEVVECKLEQEPPLCGYKILKIDLSTKDSINFNITVESLKTCLDEFPQLGKNSYDIRIENKEPIGTNPKSPTREYKVDLDKPIDICFYGTIESLRWKMLINPDPSQVGTWKPAIFIPLCDKEGNPPPCKPDKTTVLMAKWHGEDLRKVTTWFKIILGKQEENKDDTNLSDSISSQDQLHSCATCGTMVHEVIYPPQCLDSSQITTWKEIIDKSQDVEHPDSIVEDAKNNEK